MNIKKESGSAHVILISLLIIIILGLLGFVFWQNYVQKKPVSSVDTASQVANSSKAKDSQGTSRNNDYITLSDWGVKFNKSQLKSEVVVTKVSDEFGNFYDFTTKRVQAIGGMCAGSGSTGRSYALASIARSATKNDEPIGSDAVNNNLPIGGYYYYVSAAQGACSEESKDIQGQDRKDLINMLLKPIVVE